MRPSLLCIDLVKLFEELTLKAYQDEGGVWTIGYGTTKGVRRGSVCTEVQAEQWLMRDLLEAADCILENTDVALKQCEFDALCSFVYNLGCANFKNSMLRKKLNHRDYTGTAKEFLRWSYIKVNGKPRISNGLLNRRQTEQKMFLGNPRI